MLVDHPLSALVVKNARVSKFQIDRGSNEIRGAVYDGRGSLIRQSQRLSGTKGDRVQNADPEHFDFEGAFRQIEGRAIYLGHLMGHYGHFLTESVSALWAIRRFAPARMIMHPFIFGGAQKPFMKPFFDVYETADELEVIAEDLIVDELIVPERTFAVNTHMHVVQGEAYRAVKEIVAGSCKVADCQRIFLSRARLAPDQRTLDNAAEFDEAVRKLDFEIIYPETIPVEQQIAYYSRADVICGFAGSALHNSVFAKAGCHVIELGDMRSPRRPMWVQHMCDEIAGAKSTYIPYMPAINDLKHPVAAIVSTIAALKSAICSGETPNC